MTVLKFSLNPAALGKLHDALVCLGRFHESVCLEATRDHLVLSSLNSTKTGYASFTFIGDKFFTNYVYFPPKVAGKVVEKFTCRILNKALQSVFRARTADPFRERDIGIDRCDVNIEDGSEVKSRFVVQMTCRHGVLKTYHLTFEPASSMHAVFKSEMTKNVWSMSSYQLAANAAHFGPRTEQLDIYSENGKAIFTSYTEKVMAGKEVLKQPLTTSISVSISSFSHFRVADQLHIILSVKDFKSIISHASILDSEVTASYSHPSKPMQIKYGDEAMKSEFILMTMGDYRGQSATPQPADANVREQVSTHSRERQVPQQLQQLQQQSSAGMRPSPSMSMGAQQPSLPRSATANVMQQTPNVRMPPTPATHKVKPLLGEDSLFVEQDDEDQHWNPVEEDEEMLGWDANAVYEENARTISASPRSREQSIQNMGQSRTNVPGPSTQIAPTQRMSQMRGIFDEH